MSITSHIQELRRKHQTLSEQVDSAQKQPGMRDLEISHMKKQKLRIKEEIERLTA